MNFPQPPVHALTCLAALLLPALVSAQALDTGVDPAEMAYPVVITPTRLRQSLADVPASITVITATTIQKYGITTLEDALRLVPGMALVNPTGRDYSINYHGTYVGNPRRLNVLIDGASVYKASISRVDWPLLPVVLEDIDRIEVIRGTDSSAYGPNSMMAVINILTKHPKDVERAFASLSVGSHGVVQTTARLAGAVGATHFRMTVDGQQDKGYDRTNIPGGDHDTSRLRRLNLRSQTDLADGSSLDLQAAYAGGQTDVPSLTDPFQRGNSDTNRTESRVSAQWRKALSANHEVEVNVHRSDAVLKQSWTSCWPLAAFLPQLRPLFLANPRLVTDLLNRRPPIITTPQDLALMNQLLLAVGALGPNALTPSCGLTNQDGSEARTQLEFQDTFIASDALRFVTGLGLRYQSTDSQTFFGGHASNTVRWAFGHAEYRPNRWITANIGGYAEHNSLSGNTFSPRLALNAHLSDTQTVRVVFSQGTRSPDLFEKRSYWTYTFTGLSPTVFGQSSATLPVAAVGNPAIVSERIASREIGYLLVLRQLGLTLDARVFDDHLTKLIPSSQVNFFSSNQGAVRLTGAEVQATWDFKPGWSSMLNYAYLLNRDSVDIIETQQYSRHSGSVGIAHTMADGWGASLAYYGASGNGWHESSFDRIDTSLSRAFKLGSSSALASLVLTYQARASMEGNTNTVFSLYKSSYDSPLGIRGTLRLAF